MTFGENIGELKAGVVKGEKRGDVDYLKDINMPSLELQSSKSVALSRSDQFLSSDRFAVGVLRDITNGPVVGKNNVIPPELNTPRPEIPPPTSAKRKRREGETGGHASVKRQRLAAADEESRPVKLNEQADGAEPELNKKKSEAKKAELIEKKCENEVVTSASKKRKRGKDEDNCSNDRTSKSRRLASEHDTTVQPRSPSRSPVSLSELDAEQHELLKCLGFGCVSEMLESFSCNTIAECVKKYTEELKSNRVSFASVGPSFKPSPPLNGPDGNEKVNEVLEKKPQQKPVRLPPYLHLLPANVKARAKKPDMQYRIKDASCREYTYVLGEHDQRVFYRGGRKIATPPHLMTGDKRTVATLNNPIHSWSELETYHSGTASASGASEQRRANLEALARRNSSESSGSSTSSHSLQSSHTSSETAHKVDTKHEKDSLSSMCAKLDRGRKKSTAVTFSKKLRAHGLNVDLTGRKRRLRT